MKTPGLTTHELDLLVQVFRHHPEVTAADLDELPLPYRFEVQAFGQCASHH